MKIIDLLNKIARGEEAPKRFKYEDEIYEERHEGYMSETNGGFFTDRICFDLSNLNYEVEVLDDEIDIQKIRGLEEDTGDYTADIICAKINEILRVIKQLDNKMKEK